MPYLSGAKYAHFLIVKEGFTINAKPSLCSTFYPMLRLGSARQNVVVLEKSY
jgi:hypothetical protein